jgi:lactate dehydrogenase-like 2-hydroxyacid dehydrogenase
LWQRTVGILGLGEIGIELARRLQGWNCTLIYHKRRRLPQNVEAELGLTYVNRDALLAQSDYVANLLPYFRHTDLLIDAANIAKMKDGAYLVSCGSGSVIDEHALAEAIQNHKLGGAALDTFEWEPIKPDNPLIGLARDNYNVLLTPHIAAGTTSAARQQRVGDYTNIMNDIKGMPLNFRVA